MKITIVNKGESFLPEKALSRIEKDVVFALSNVTANSDTEFIINSSIWYSITVTKKGEKKAQPRVVNSADYISKLFGKNLSTKGWIAGAKEKTLNGQKIDGYIELDTPVDLFKIDEERFLDFFNHLMKGTDKKFPNLRAAFNYYYSRYCKEGWEITKDFEQLKHYFSIVEKRKIRVGLEFETGNIASSFRALSKLDNLFHEGHIDFGVFITSLDRNSTATKIWPVTNRNGSFHELNNRNYKDGLTVPLLEIGFQPDKLSSEALYLGSAGELFEPTTTSIFETISGTKFEKHEYKNSAYWKKT